MNAQLRRFAGNPIVERRNETAWESRACFNPAAVLADGVVHLLYRAIGHDDDAYVSRLGYATSTDGFHFERASGEPVLAPGADYERGAIEDARLVSIEGETYVTYVAVGVPAFTPNKLSVTALARTADFRTFERMGVITPRHDIDDRDTVLMPERFEGDYAMLHRPQQIEANGDYQEWGTGLPSSIWLSFSPSLTHWGMGSPLLRPEQPWEAFKIGVGPPPLRTVAGWLVLYHGVDAGSVYRAGAALLDLDDPSAVTGRLQHPILEPEAPYEVRGDHAAAVFPEGAVVLDGQLLVYYGGADQVCAVATIALDELLADLMATRNRLSTSAFTAGAGSPPRRGG